MAVITAVELGPDTCALARTSARQGVVRLFAAEILDPAAFPGAEAFTMAVRQARRVLRLPRRCRVVLWGLPDGVTRDDGQVKRLLAPLVAAGFKVERVVSPCNGLAALARVKASRGEGSTCWVAINRGGVAIVVVRPGQQLYARSFPWDSTVGATGSQARLLQRYSLVSFLSPEVKRAMTEARKAGSPVDVVVTCGNLPDLRSLTMPLIEELDVEVEPLDSLEGLAVKPDAADKLGPIAAAIRLACAAAIARGSRPWLASRRRAGGAAAYLRIAVLAALLGLGLAYLWYTRTRPEAPPAPAPASRQTRAPVPSVSAPVSPPKSNPPAVSAPVTLPKSNPPAVSAPATPPKSNPPSVSAPVTPPKSNPPAVSAPVTPPKSNPPAVSAPVTPPKSNPPAVSAPVTPPKSNPTAVSAPATPPKSNPPAVSAPVSQPKSNPPAVSAAPAVSRPGSALNAPAVPADKLDAGPTRPAAPARTVSRGPAPAPLRDAIPRVTGILVSRERRYATIEGGQIVGIGDLLGRRTVVGMDERSVVLQEPSGVQIRVGLGGRLLGVERTTR